MDVYIQRGDTCKIKSPRKASVKRSTLQIAKSSTNVGW